MKDRKAPPLAILWFFFSVVTGLSFEGCQNHEQPAGAQRQEKAQGEEKISSIGPPAAKKAAQAGSYDEILRRSKKEEDWEGYFTALYQKAEGWQKNGRNDSVAVLLEQGISDHNKLFPDSATVPLGQMHRLLATALYETHTADYDVIVAHYEKALAIFERLRLPREEALSKRFLGAMLYQNNEPEKGEAYLTTALEWFKKDEEANMGMIGSTLFHLGILYRQQYQHEKAIAYLEESLEYSIPAKDTVFIGYGYNNLGMTLSFRYEYQAALEYCFKALEIFKEYHGDQHSAIGFVYNGIGNLYFQQGQYQPALEYFRKGYEIFRATIGEQSFTTSGLLMNIGVMYEKMERYDEALAIYRKVIEVHQQQPNPHYDKFKVHRNIALVHLARGDTLGARRKLLDAQRAGESAIEKHSMLWVDLFLDQAALAENYAEAARYCQKAVQQLYDDKSSLLELHPGDFDHARSPLYLFRVATAQARYALESYRRSGGAEYLAHAGQLSRLGAELADYIRRHQRSEESKFEFMNLERSHLKTSAETAHLIYRQTPSPHILGRILQLIEQHKGLLLSEALAEKRARPHLGIPDSILGREARLFAAINREKKKLVSGADSAEVLAQLFEFRRELSGLKGLLTERYPTYYRLKYQENRLSIADIQAHLSRSREPTILIEYLVNDEFMSILGIAEDTVAYHHQGLDDEFYKMLADMRRLTGRSALPASDHQLEKEKRQYLATAGALYNKLLAPVLEQLPEARQLIIIPDGELGYLPFELLLSGPAEQRDYRHLPYLFREYTIRYEYSARLLLEPSRPGKKRRFGKLLAVAPQFGKPPPLAASARVQTDTFRQAFPGLRDGMAPLQYNIPEARTIHEQMGGKKLAGPQATKNAFLREAAVHRIIHLATHAYTNDLYPNFSHLAFAGSPDTAESSLLYAYEIYNLRLNAELAVLSACEAGAGKLQRGEGVMSLSRAFKYAGCPNIVTSLWQADDRSTKDIMVSFYRHLKAGAGKADALRQAKQDFLAEAGQRYTHPFYWGTFILIGDNEPVDLGGGRLPLWSGAAGLALLGLLGLWWWRKQ